MMVRVQAWLLALCAARLALGQFPAVREVEVRIGGLQRPAITAIAQDEEGFIWTGSDMGLLRLDGETAEVMLPLVRDRVQALLPMDSGMLAALSSGTLVHCFSGGCDTLFQDTTLVKFPALALLRSGNHLLAATAGAGIRVHALQGAAAQPYIAGLPDPHVNGMCALPDGRVALATDQGLAICSGNRVQYVFGEHEGAPDNLTYCVRATKEGLLWAGTDQAGAFLLDPDSRTILDRILPEALGGPVLDLQCTDRSIWSYGTASGPLMFDRANQVFGYRPKRGPGDEERPVTSMLADREGAVWWCDGTDRLYRADPAVLILPELGGVDLSHITALCARPDRLWFASGNQLYTVGTEMLGEIQPERIAIDVDARTPIVSLDVARNGTCWAATFGSGVYALHAEGTVTHYDAQNGPVDPNVLCVRANGNDTWLATLKGMSRIRNGVVTNFRSPGSGFMFMVLPLPNGSVLGASDGSGVVRWNDGVVRELAADGPRTVYSLALDTAGRAWASGPSQGLCQVTDTGLACVAGSQNLLEGDLLGLATTGDQVLVFFNKGCHAYDVRSGRWAEISVRAGLEGMDAQLNTVVSAGNGTFWLACSKGLVRIDADRSWFQPVLPVAITGVSVDHEPVAAKWEFTTPYDRNSISFRFSAPYYPDPAAVNFEYRLLGLPGKTVRSREREVSFPALPPGSYKFQVRAFIGGDPGTAQWSLFTIVVAPPWWKRWWFRTAMLIAMFVAVGVLIRQRERNIRRKQGMEQDRVRFQLEALRSQVDPHFMFNSFNALVDLIETEPGKAVGHVEDLSAFFRSMIQLRDRELIALEEELELLQDYFCLEKRRFGNAVLLEVHVPDALLRHKVAPLTLQMLAENAVKHNAASMDRPMVLSITSSNVDLIISNTVQRRETPVKSTGFGLESIRKRYAALSQRPVRVESSEERFTVTIPLIPPEQCVR